MVRQGVCLHRKTFTVTVTEHLHLRRTQFGSSTQALEVFAKEDPAFWVDESLGTICG